MKFGKTQYATKPTRSIQTYKTVPNSALIKLSSLGKGSNNLTGDYCFEGPWGHMNCEKLLKNYLNEHNWLKK